MYKIPSLVAFFLFLINCSLSAQKAVITGRILDSRSNPVRGASVYILNTATGTFTDAQGIFQLTNLYEGNCSIQVSAIGFATIDTSFYLASANNQQLNIILQSDREQLDAVIVTAQKKEEILQQVPVSITALSSKKVEEYRIWNSREITAIVPNLYSADPGDKRNVTSIRGITSTSYDPSVATYIDGVNQFTLDTYIAGLFDIDRIEVLRGPQGTLYGRNAMGGVINIITKQPINKTRGFAEISLGNYGLQRYSAGISSPVIADKLYVGVAGMYDHLNGYYRNEFDNTRFDRQHSTSTNFYLKYLPGSHWSVTANVKQQFNRNNGVFPLAGSASDAFSNPFVVNQNAVTEIIDNIFNSSLAVAHNGRIFNFSSETAYQSDYRYYTKPIDGDFSPIDGVTIINNYGKKWNNVKAVTQEFRFTSAAGNSSKLKWTAGTYFFYNDNPTKQATRFGKDAALVGAPDSLFSIITSTKGTRTGFALYGQASYELTNYLELIAGLRYDYEHVKLDVLGQYQHDPDPDPAFDTRPDTAATTSFNSISPKLGLAWHLTGRNNIFLSYSRGYRTGGLTQLSSDPSQPPLYEYKPEYSNNIEIGIKNNTRDNKLVLNVTAFYSTVTNAQVPTLVLPDAITVTKNAGKLESSGIEVELAAAPLKGLQVDYNFGYTHARYQQLKLSQNGSETDLKGNRQIFTPEVTSMLAAQYKFSADQFNKIQLSVRGEWMYIGEEYFDLANSIKQSPYSLFNAGIGIDWKFAEVLIWGRNISNKRYISYAYDFGAVHLGNPSTFGVTLKARF